MKYEELPIIDVKKEVDGKEKVIGKEIDPSKLDEIEWPIEFTFKKPLNDKNSIVEKSVFREPTIGDIEIAQKEGSELNQNKKLLTLLADNLSPEAINQVVPRDFTKMLVMVTPFLG